MSQQGRRWFRCETDGTKWRSAHRAAMSQAPEDCADCGTSVTPMFGEVDETIQVDGQGDVVTPEVASIRSGLRSASTTVNGGRK